MPAPKGGLLYLVLTASKPSIKPLANIVSCYICSDRQYKRKNTFHFSHLPSRINGRARPQNHYTTRFAKKIQETMHPAKASPFGSNGDDRRQWRKQGGAVGAAASRMRAAAKQTLGAATRAVSPKVTERASPAGKSRGRSDGQALCQSDTIAVSGIRRQRPSPLSLVASSSPAPPKGEPLACRSAFVWTLKARRGAKGRALLQRPAASGQRSLSSCRWPRQRSTTVPETSCFARPVGSEPACQRLSLWGRCHACGPPERATVNLWKMHE